MFVFCKDFTNALIYYYFMSIVLVIFFQALLKIILTITICINSKIDIVVCLF